MRLIILCLLHMIVCVVSKSNTKSLTESMGQEVIEIGVPLKDLPSDMEEEPSAEADEDDPSTATIAPATRKDLKKTTATDGRRKMKDIDVIDRVADDEARVEKELAEIYKDSNDYNTDSGEVATTNSTTAATAANVTQNPALRNRGRDAFKFQPDLNNAKEIERFRTSIDEISCDKSVTRKLDKTKPSSATSVAADLLLLASSFIIFG